MQEQKGGRVKSESKNISLKLSKNAVDMLNEIQKLTGAETTAEAVRLCIFDFYNRKIAEKEKNNP